MRHDVHAVKQTGKCTLGQQYCNGQVATIKGKGRGKFDWG